MMSETERVPRGYKVKPRSIIGIRKIAHDLRNLFQIKKPYLEIIRVLDVIVAEGFFELEILPDDSLTPGELGETRLIKVDNEFKPLIRLKEEVYNGADQGDGFHRFTVAHEIAHALLHIQDLKLSRSIEHREKKEWFSDSEWQANTFAAEFLADICFITSSDGILTLINKFGISPEAADIRLKKLIVRGEL